MLQKGDKVVCYVDDVEKHKTFEVVHLNINLDQAILIKKILENQEVK